MSAKLDERPPAIGLHYHVSDLTNVDPLGLNTASCDVGQKHTVADYMTTIERKPYENQNLCRKNGIRGIRNKGTGGCGEKKRFKRQAPPPPLVKKTLKDMAQEYLTTLETDYVVTVETTDPSESFVQLTTETKEPGMEQKSDEQHMYDTISGHYKKKEANSSNGSTEKQDTYYIDIIDDYNNPAFPTSSCSYDEIKCKTLSLSRHKHAYSSTGWKFLNRTKELMMTELIAKLPATRSRRLITISVAFVLLLCSIWLVAAAASKPNNTNGLIFPTQTHQLIGGTVGLHGSVLEVTLPVPTSSLPVSPESACNQDCRGKARTPVCASNRRTYNFCEFEIAKCKKPKLYLIGEGSCRLYSSDEMEDD